MGYETLLIEKEGAVAVVKINRPPVNSLNVAAYVDIYSAFSELERDEGVNAIVLTGAGEKAFAAGLDIKDVAGKSIPGYFAFGRTSRMTVDKVASVDKPTVAALFGFVFGGGCELALACDLRIAALDASIGCPEVNLGIIPGSGGTQRLTRLVGMTKAKEMLMLGDAVTGEEAYRIGLVNQVVENDHLIKRATEWATDLSALSPVATRLELELLDRSQGEGFDGALALESGLAAIAVSSEEARFLLGQFLTKGKEKNPR